MLRQPSGPVLANKGVGTLTLGCSVSLLTLLSVTLPRGHLGVTLSILPGPNEETKAQREKLPQPLSLSQVLYQAHTRVIPWAPFHFGVCSLPGQTYQDLIIT